MSLLAWSGIDHQKRAF